MKSQPTKLIVGLGNPGAGYEKTWHNLGFLAIDRFLEAQAEHFGQFKLSRKHQAWIATGSLNDNKVILIKPETFMNRSGEAVSSILNFYKLSAADLVVIHDEIDLPVGSIRISRDASAAGNKGVQSIIDAVGSQNFIRIRIGINSPDRGRISTEDYVLQKISAPATIDKTLNRSADAAASILTGPLETVMNRFN